MPLAPGKTKKIERLLKEGSLSKRAISRQENVSRVTIDRIEKRILFPGENPYAVTGKQEYIRCKGCGGRILASAPCMVCQLRRQQIKDYDNYMDELLIPPSILAQKRAQGDSNGKKVQEKIK